MKVSILAILALILASLACQQAVIPLTLTPTVPPTLTPSPAPARVTPSATAEDETDTAIVRQPVVNIRNAAGGDPTGEYITAGQEVTILEMDGDWVHIAEPPGWVYIGCLEGLSEKGCIADE
jgi:uncharacterized protein YgiM (DUF1202 family)